MAQIQLFPFAGSKTHRVSSSNLRIGGRLAVCSITYKPDVCPPMNHRSLNFADRFDQDSGSERKPFKIFASML